MKDQDLNHVSPEIWAQAQESDEAWNALTDQQKIACIIEQDDQGTTRRLGKMYRSEFQFYTDEFDRPCCAWAFAEKVTFGHQIALRLATIEELLGDFDAGAIEVRDEDAGPLVSGRPRGV
jgi:hypothetical protein